MLRLQLRRRKGDMQIPGSSVLSGSVLHPLLSATGDGGDGWGARVSQSVHCAIQ